MSPASKSAALVYQGEKLLEEQTFIPPSKGHQMNSKALVAALFAGVISASVFAQTTTPPASTSTPVIDKRAADQQKRIDAGVASGQLTAKETNNLDKREAKLNTDITAAKADGKVTAAERAKLTKEENRNSKKIFKKKHNAKVATPAAQ
jgi:opacity protein-like surface antigen